MMQMVGIPNRLQPDIASVEQSKSIQSRPKGQKQEKHHAIFQAQTVRRYRRGQ